MLRLIGLIVVIAVSIILWNSMGSSTVPGPSAPVSIADLVRSPEKHEGKKVTTEGVVVRRLSIMGLGGYELAEKGASIIVLSGRTPPVPGSKASATGIVSIIATAGSSTVVGIREEHP